MNEELKQTILDLLKPKVELLGMTIEEVNHDESLTQTGVLDSFSFLEYMTDIEDECGIELDFSEIDPSEFTSVNALVKLIGNIKS